METEKEITFLVATNLDYFGSEAKESDVKDYADFAESYLLVDLGYEKVEIEFVDNYPSSWNDSQYELRQTIWGKYCGQ
jgi:hypothetical protein